MTSKTFFKYVIPTILAVWVSSIYTLVDGFSVARFVGPEVFAAVSLAMPVTNALFSSGILMSMGTSTRIGTNLGKDQVDKVNEIFSSVLFGSSFFALMTSIPSMVLIEPLAYFLGATGDLHDLVIDHLSLVLPFTFFFILSYILEILVKVGDTPILSTIGVLSSVLTSIVLDYVFIRFFGWGIKRAAFATGLVQVLPFVIFLRHFLARKGRLRILLIKSQLASLVKAMKIGFGDLLTELSYSATLFFFNRSLLTVYEETGLIPYTTINYFSLLLTMTMPDITQGPQPLFSLYYGREGLGATRKIPVSALATVFVASMIFFLPAQLLPSSLIQVFIPKAERTASDLAIYALRFYSISYPFLGYSILVSGMSTALNRPRLGILVSLSRGFIFIFIFLHLLEVLAPNFIWLAGSLAEVATPVLTIFSVLHPKEDLAKQGQVERL